MSVLSGKLIVSKYPDMILPMALRQYHESGLTYGLGPAGYDVRVKEFDAPSSNFVSLAPGKFVLASIIERLRMPDDVIAFVCDKSTWARQGLALQNTVVEPGWRGYLTIELSNHGNDRLEIVAGTPIAQLVFHRVEGVVLPYDGRYQDQPSGPQKAILR